MGGVTLKNGERTILTNTTSSGKLDIDSNYQTFEIHSGFTKTNPKIVPNIGLSGSFQSPRVMMRVIIFHGEIEK